MPLSSSNAVPQPTDPEDRTTTDQVLDLLLEALERRREERHAEEAKTVPGDAGATPRQQIPVVDAITAEEPDPTRESVQPTSPAVEPSVDEQEADQPAWQPAPGINLGRTLVRLSLIVALLAIVINIPLNRHGTSLARIMPDSASLVIRDGLVVKGSGPNIYVLEDDRLRWITSLEAFEYFGYQWDQVHIVDDSFLAQFEEGRPIHVLLKCPGSLHIYALENGQKRWIKDIPTFESVGYQWEDVKTVDCSYLRSLPDGPTIPEDAGPPPQP